MANNLIQVKRSNTTAIPVSLANGEFAMTSNGDVLYIGSNSAIVPIAGKRFPGTLTANQALVANATSGIDKIITANLVPTNIWANGASGTAGDVLTSNGTVVYWKAPTSAVAGSLTQVQYNDAGSLAGAVGFTYDKNTNNVQFANSLNIPANGAFGNTTTGGSLANSTVFATGNSSVNAVHSSSLVQVSNSTSIANLTAADLKIGATTVVNSTQITATLAVANLSGTYANITGQVNTSTLYAATSANVASVFQANTLGIFSTLIANAQNFTAGAGFGAATAGATVNSGTIGISSNTTVNATHTAALVQVSNSTSTANLTALDLKIGATTVVNSTQITATLAVANLSGTYANITGQVNTSTLYAATSANIASVTQANTLGVFSTGLVNAASHTTGTAFGAAGATINTTHIAVSTNSTVNATHTASLMQISNSTSTANLTAIDIKIGNFIANTTQVTLGGTLSANGGAGTAGYLLVSGAATNAYWSNTLGNIGVTDLIVSGNLTVLGDFVSINVSSLAIEDPLITLAKDQSATATYTDAVDIGFVATYGNTATANANWTGLFRDQNDSGIYKLFSGNIPVPTTTVDTANLNFTFATLQAQLRAGGSGASALIANSSHVNITANSTTNVFITANTLALSTALPATSGGTGKGTIGVGSILVGNSTNLYTELVAGTDGYVLQINGTGVVAWNTLDGGTF